MQLAAIQKHVENDLQTVNELIEKYSRSEVRLIEKLSKHIVESGGKRLRPLMLLLSANACGQSDFESRCIAAASIEYFHTASLLHDDVIDESSLRRGQETSNEIWGSKASILVGDHLYTQALRMLMSIKRLDALSLFTETAHLIIQSEVKQLSHRHQLALSEQDYFEVIKGKTALLFAASAKMGALLSESPLVIQNALYDYGLYVGNAFQLLDDALDYSNSELIGKNIGDDLADGKMTLPLIYALKNSNQNDATLIKEALLSGDRQHLNKILQIINETKAIEYTKLSAQNEIDKAIAELNVLEDSTFKQGLIELAKFAISRTH